MFPEESDVQLPVKKMTQNVNIQEGERISKV